MIVDTLVTSHLMAVCSKLQRRATLGRIADVDCRGRRHVGRRHAHTGLCANHSGA